MNAFLIVTRLAGVASLGGGLLACSANATEADRYGVAATCRSDSDCAIVMIGEDETQLTCLEQFDAGYCALGGCASAADCPDGSTCVAHDDGQNYCFRECSEKSECNANRPPDSEANCSANFDYASNTDDTEGMKACIPPSSGD